METQSNIKYRLLYGTPSACFVVGCNMKTYGKVSAKHPKLQEHKKGKYKFTNIMLQFLEYQMVGK